MRKKYPPLARRRVRLYIYKNNIFTDPPKTGNNHHTQRSKSHSRCFVFVRAFFVRNYPLKLCELKCPFEFRRGEGGDRKQCHSHSSLRALSPLSSCEPPHPALPSPPPPALAPDTVQTGAAVRTRKAGAFFLCVSLLCALLPKSAVKKKMHDGHRASP